MREVTLQRAGARPFTIAGAVLFGVLCWVYYPVISGMVSEWYNNPNYSHGFIIPVISGYFLWTRRVDVKNAVLRPTNWGGLVIVAGLAMYILGNLGAAHTTMRVSMLIVLAGLILFICGRELFRTVRMPFFYLFFMIPVPAYLYDTVAFPLKLFVTKLSVVIMKSVGIPVLREGNVIMLENITLQVVDACSGIRSLTSLVALAIALAYVSQKTVFGKGFLVLAAFPIAVLCNILRIVTTGVLAKYYGSGVAEGFFHEFAGLGVFLLSVVMLIGTGAALNKTKRMKGQE
jgi:exosortase